jgi:signal transduction histidine kinase/CheY-like chemotaxis protein/HPt (histidine-containing phosphotransfer) domain-containing protein
MSADPRLLEIRQRIRRWLTEGADFPGRGTTAAAEGDEIEALRADVRALEQALEARERKRAETEAHAEQLIDALLALSEIDFSKLAGGGEATYSIEVLTSAVNRLADEMEVSQRELARRAEELARAKDAAEEATRAKSQFLANMSHEIRTPLTAVIGFADLLLDPHLSHLDRTEYVQTIRRNGEHLLLLINDILDLSKIEAQRMSVEEIPCSLHQLLHDVASMMRVRAASKGLTFELVYDTPIPERITGDPTRLRQILINLVNNAVKFTPRGGVSIAVSSFAGEGAASRIEVDVIDTGIGISPEQQERLFQPFSQANSSMSRRFGGTGLGLAICRHLAALLGGEITVSSRLGEGSRFRLTLWQDIAADTRLIRHPSDVADHDPSEVHEPSSVSISGRVLLAEDGPDNQLLIKTILESRGLEVTIAATGRVAVDEAMRALRNGRPYDVILMDIQMPELDGYSATSQLRAHNYPGVIIALTAHALGAEDQRCLAAGCDDYMSKPVERGQLLALVASHLHRHGGGSVEADARPSREVGESRQGLLYSTYAHDAEMVELISSFVRRLPSQLEEIRSAARGGRLDAVRKRAHQLKGAGGGYGFQAVSDRAAQLEHAASHGSEAEVEAAIDELAELCRRVRSGPQPRPAH